MKEQSVACKSSFSQTHNIIFLDGIGHTYVAHGSRMKLGHIFKVLFMNNRTVTEQWMFYDVFQKFVEMDYGCSILENLNC